MTYNQTLGFLFSRLPAYHRIGKAAYKNNLDNSNALDKYFGHPHLNYKTIHIAGTNGTSVIAQLIMASLNEYSPRVYTRQTQSSAYSIFAIIA